MYFDFDRVIDRRSSDSIKWRHYADDILPLWVADMDFAAPEPVIEALRRRVDQGIFGYSLPPPALVETLCERMARLYDWQVSPEQILFLPGLVCGLNLLCRAIGEPGDAVIVQTPVYPPFLDAPSNQGRNLVCAALRPDVRGSHLYYSSDEAGFEAAVTERTRLFLLCHPHNPVGRVFGADELSRLADICSRRDIIICSDEAHCDLLLGGAQHRPLASLSPEIAERCVTLMAPSKTFNLPGLGMSFAIVQNPDLLRCLQKAAADIVPAVNALGYHAALAAYRDCDDWLQALRAYLTANRDYAVEFVANHLPGVRATVPEATYLLWLDFRFLANPHRYLLERAKVALYDGRRFGPGGEGFLRLNFGCPRSTLNEALRRIEEALIEPAL